MLCFLVFLSLSHIVFQVWYLIVFIPDCCLPLYLAIAPTSPDVLAGLFPAILGKGPWPKLGKMINLTSKLGEINEIEHNKGSKIYPQNQVILDSVMPSIPLMHKCLSIILI